ncbi:transposase [Streptomyces flavidovirens]
MVAAPEHPAHRPGAGRPGPQARPPRQASRTSARVRQTALKRRNVVERCFNRLKQWRSIATGYDKTAESYQAAVTLASLLMWE